MNSYPGPYGQVLTNLVLIFAVHAYPDGARGAVHIAAQASGKHSVEVLFSDDGCHEPARSRVRCSIHFSRPGATMAATASDCTSSIILSPIA